MDNIDFLWRQYQLEVVKVDVFETYSLTNQEGPLTGADVLQGLNVIDRTHSEACVLKRCVFDFVV